MNATDRLSSAIGNIDDRFILEAGRYCSWQKMMRKYKVLGIAVAGICLVVGIVFGMLKNDSMAITVYAYETDAQLLDGEMILMPGTISDTGEMKGHPLQFYILGDKIANIRFSCKNEKISFTDWTEQRADYGLNQNFTVTYGENKEDYYYLVIDWTPEHIIQTLTDDKNVKIADLSQEEKEDIIVMEVTYLNGESEVFAIKIHLEDSGKFQACMERYEITEEDVFVRQQDGDPIENSTKEETELVELSEDEMDCLKTAMEEYYTAINKKMTGCLQVSFVPFDQVYEGYETGEVVLFEVYLENDEEKRYIVIGSKDNWKNCNILNEGY